MGQARPKQDSSRAARSAQPSLPILFSRHFVFLILSCHIKSNIGRRSRRCPGTLGMESWSLFWQHLAPCWCRASLAAASFPNGRGGQEVRSEWEAREHGNSHFACTPSVCELSSDVRKSQEKEKGSRRPIGLVQLMYLDGPPTRRVGTLQAPAETYWLFQLGLPHGRARQKRHSTGFLV